MPDRLTDESELPEHLQKILDEFLEGPWEVDSSDTVVMADRSAEVLQVWAAGGLMRKGLSFDDAILVGGRLTELIAALPVFLAALQSIAFERMTPDEIREKGKEKYGLEPEEVIEISYDNIQTAAKNALELAGVKCG